MSRVVAARAPQPLVVGRIGWQRLAWLVASVERVLPMAQVTRVTGQPSSVAGLLDVHGHLLTVVDPRHQLGLPTVAARPEQHLMLMASSSGNDQYVLWVDAVEDIVSVDASEFESTHLVGEGVDGDTRMVRIDGQLVRVVSAEDFSPSYATRRSGGIR